MDYREMEKKWQERWEEAKIFKAKPSAKKKKFYCLEMYPYPSGKLHIGHLRNYVIGDCIARYKRMVGHNVLYPIGYDAFGLPAENAAIKHKADPETWTRSNIEYMTKQLKRIGTSYDWARQIQSCDEEYYKWNQWMFLKFREMGLVEQKESFVNWCPDCGTVLANEQVINKRCYRCSTEIEQKELRQWYFKITKYADELLNDLDGLDWPENVKIMQRNWIGRSEGTLVDFGVKDTHEVLPIFTTRIDTIYGVTFMVFAPEHPLVRKWIKGTRYAEEFNAFFREVQKEDAFERTAAGKEKKGMFIGKYAINPITGDEVPIYVGNFVLYDYGAGAVMAVPAHDQRDFEFAKKFNIPVKLVIMPDTYELTAEKMIRAYEGDGKLVNSGEFDKMENRSAIKEISEKLKEMDKGGPTVTYKLRDWLLSRQRYWGTPIPIIYCSKCGVVPVPYKDLPVRLPKDAKFTGSGNPLVTSDMFVNCKCPKCGGPAKRETDTMDTFIDSSWYFFRYCDPKNKDLPFSTIADHWMPVDQYIGGIEHAILHLMYARFFTKVLRDMGLTKVNEPFKKLLCQGMVNKEAPFCEKCGTSLPIGKHEDGKCTFCGSEHTWKIMKMSKSYGNVVDPDEVIIPYGADTARVFMLHAANPEKEFEWDKSSDAENICKALNRIYDCLTVKPEKTRERKDAYDEYLSFQMNKMVKSVTENIESLNLRFAVQDILSFAKMFSDYRNREVHKRVFEKAKDTLMLILSPFAPHMCEEAWELNGGKGFVSVHKWPKYDPKFVNEGEEHKWDMYKRIKDDIGDILAIIKKDKPQSLKIMAAAGWKYEFVKQFGEQFAKTKNQGEIISAIMKTDLRTKGKDVTDLIMKYLKDPGLMPQREIGQKDELKFLNDVKGMLSSEMGCPVEVAKEEDSTEPKAKRALPEKPSILVG